MKARTQKLIGLIILFLVTFSPASSFAHGNRKGKKHGHHKHHYHEHKAGPPSWAPAHGYRSAYGQVVAAPPAARYVYNPEYNIYYDRKLGLYIFLQYGAWTYNAQLPKRLNHRAVRNGFQVNLTHANDCRSAQELMVLENRNRRNRSGR